MNAPAAVLGSGVIGPIYEFAIRCGYCPNPHPLALCGPHARHVAEVEPCYTRAEAGSLCRVCEEMEENPIVNLLLKSGARINLDSLIGSILNFDLRGRPSGHRPQ